MSRRPSVVYRIENEGRVGPYQAEGSWWQDGEHSENTGRPGPYSDAGIVRAWAGKADRDELLFGFTSVAQLCRWFSRDERKALVQHGFRIKRIQNVTVKASSEFQCLFKYRKPKRRPEQ